MARGKAAERPSPPTMPEDDDELNPRVGVEPQPDDPDDIAIMNLMASMGEQEAMVHIYRQGDNARDLELLDGVPVQNFDVMMLASEPYNGGSFRIHVRSKGGLVANRFIKVKGKPKPPAAPDVMTPQTLAAVIAESIRAAMPATPAQPATPAVDPFDMMMKMSEMMKNLQPPQPAAPAVVTPPAKTLTEQIADISAIVNLSKTLGAGGDPETGVMSTLLEKGGDILSAFAAAKANAPQPAPVMLPNPAAPLAPTNPHTEQDDAAMFEKLLFRAALTKACNVAANNGDVEEFAAKYYEDIPEAVLTDIVTNPEWFHELCNIHADCGKYEAWFTSLRALLVQWVAEDAQPDTPAVDNVAIPGQTDPQVIADRQEPPNVQIVSDGNYAVVTPATTGGDTTV